MISKTKVIDEDTKKEKYLFKVSKPFMRKEDDIFINSNPNVPLTHIAYQFYGDITYWKIIATANNLTTLFPPENMKLRIPANPEISFELE